MLIDASQALVAFAVFAGGIVCGLTGFAFSAGAGAILLHVMPPKEAVPFMMVCSVLLQGAMMLTLREHLQWRRAAALIVGGLAGLAPGIWLLQHVDARPFRIGFGVFLTAYAAYMLFRPRLARLPERPGALGDGSVGFAGGVIGGLTAMPGAAPTLWCDLCGIAKDRSRGLLQPYIAAMQVAALVLLFATGSVPAGFAAHLGIAVPALLAGGAIGRLLYGKVNDALFRRAVLGALLVSGIGFLGYR